MAADASKRFLARANAALRGRAVRIERVTGHPIGIACGSSRDACTSLTSPNCQKTRGRSAGAACERHSNTIIVTEAVLGICISAKLLYTTKGTSLSCGVSGLTARTSYYRRRRIGQQPFRLRIYKGPYHLPRVGVGRDIVAAGVLQYLQSRAQRFTPRE